MKRYIIVIFSYLNLIALQAQDYSFKYYFTIIDGHNGLSQTDIKAILQDSDGFMWFGTRNKLNRFDGNSIRVFDCHDLITGKRNNNISYLFEDNEKKIWVGTDNGVFIFDPVCETFSFVGNRTANNVMMKDWVSDIKSDADGNIWIVLPNQGLFKYRKDKKLYYYPLGNSKLPDQGNPQCLCIDQSGRLWIGTNGKGVYLYDKESDRFTQYLGDNNGETLDGENIYKMCDYGDDLVIGIHEGKLRKLNKRRNTLTDVNAPEVHYKIIRDVICFGEELWVGTQSGVYVVDELKNKVSHIYGDPMCPYSLSDNQIGRIYKDKENGIWIGTNSGGVNYLPQRGIEFFRHIPLNRPYSISSKRVREMVEDENGNIWIGTEDAGLNIYNPQTNTFKRMGRDVGSGMDCEKTLALLSDNGNIWVGFFKKGLDIIDRKNYSTRYFSGKQLGLNEYSVYALCEDRNGKIWIGNGWGVYTGDKQSMSFSRLPQFGLNFIFDIIEDSNGYIWVATMGNGVYKYNPKDGKVVHFVYHEGDKTSLSSNSVSNIKETGTGEIWFSTDRGGICRYNKDRNNFTTFSVMEGLPDDTAYKMLEDKNGNLWFGTNNGLVKFDPREEKCEVFTTDNGLPGNQFHYKSALMSSTGLFYFGSSEGLISFDPYQIRKNDFVPPVFITKLTIGNKEINLQTDKTPLEKSILHTDKITLNYNQANIGFEFVALSYVAPSANGYAYKMENVDDDWVYTRNNHGVSYANLSPGKYIFRVKGSNNDGIWNDTGTSIEIEVLPPWWRSTVAYIIYYLLVAFAFYLWFRWYKRRNELKSVEKQKLFETEKEKELYSSKVEFFTHIAHEIRTPITLINGPLESMLEMDIQDSEMKKNLQLMNKNTSELLTLINQLLDFRKVDSNEVQMNFVTINMSGLLKEVYLKFEPMALSENRQLTLSLPESDIYVSADRNSLVKILNNLFSNAIRYSECKIEVVLERNGSSLEVIVLNDGELVPSELSDKIFDPFYQMKKNANARSSSGIGLSLARSLSELHHGSLSFEERNGLNCFVLKLPAEEKVCENELQSHDDDFIVEETGVADDKQNVEVILVVEDNVELLKFMVDKLRHQFAVEQAENGVEAMKILEEKSIDMVVTDIMMPEMDGFELCRNIKSNIEFSHIPVVLLTAKNDLDSKIQGLKMGADAYIEKPFSFQYLMAQLNSLFDNRKREKEAFMRKPFLPTQSMGMSKADEELMDKIIGVIEDNITDPNFGVERLAEIVFMSRSSLHRKIKALSGTSPTDFIRLIRLKKATELIIDGRYRTGEVCYLVGINSPSYFIKLFQKQFGVTPKEFEKQQRQAQSAQ